MKKTLQYSIICSLFFIFSPILYAQEGKAVNFYDKIKSYDLSTILIADSILTEYIEDEPRKIKQPEILGFIGDQYQRMYIHFISIIQDPENPYLYFAYGKTRVKGNICSFQGTIVIKEAKIHKNDPFPAYQQGYATCEVKLFEDKNQSHTGYFKGELISHFIIDDKGRFRYDALQFNSDGFSNNQFTGSWTSYKTNISKKCNWGDFRIPDCGDLDIGAGEFSVNDSYVQNGWENYMLLLFGHYGEDSPQVKKAKLKENEKWWK